MLNSAGAMIPRVRIRLFCLEDLDRILMLERAVFPEDAYGRELFLDLYRKYSGLFFVAATGDGIAGYCLSAVARGCGEIVSIAVGRRWQGQGIGGKLMRRSVRALAAAGVRAVTLAVREKNTPAIQFYRRLGFVRVRRVPAYYEDGGNALRMRLQLPDYAP